ncbi:MAG: ubiquinone biosynthesis protein Coq4 [Arenicella sp.]|jgi:ubiquinone biosynthesis protein Coq4
MNIREKFCARLFAISEKPYRFLFKRKVKAWNLSSDDLLCFPENSLGFATGSFLRKNEFELLDKLEAHDVFHVLLGMQTSVKEEIGMQFILFGNGKRSFYLFATMTLGFVLQAEHYKYFKYCYQKGKGIRSFAGLKMKELLTEPLLEIRNGLKIQSTKMKEAKIVNQTSK